MKKIVILAEKPSVARVIATVLSANQNHSNEGYIEGNNHIVTWAFGHLIAYAQPHEYGFKSYERDSLPMLPQNFKFVIRQVKDKAGKYNDDPGAVKQLKVLKRLFDEASSLICATDAGREGEAIFRFIYHFLNCTKPFQRLWISSLTDKAIREGLSNLKPGSDFDNLYAAAETRSKSDWLIGMNASQALTIAAQQGTFSLGRVQTPTLAMLCQRYQDNKDFVPKKYWQIRLKSEKYGVEFFMSSLQKFDNRQQAEEVMNAIRQEGKIKVVKTETKEVVNEPPLLHDLTSLQREANNKYGFSADKTLTIAQLLYEHRLITYPRTGSRFIPDDVFEQIPVLLDNLQQYPTFAGAALDLKNKPLNRKSLNPAKVTDHHALLPTETHLSPFQNEDEKRIFDLVAGRMLEAISDKCIKEVVTDTLSCKEVEFILRGTTIRSAGWKAIFNEPEEEKEENNVLPVMHEDESLDILAAEIAEKQTKPQPIHTDASLLAAMEQAGKSLEDEEKRNVMKGIGIGTPATRAAIIETLIFRGYIKRDKKNLVPTEKGLSVFDVVKNMKVSDVAMTAEWEAELAKIEQGEVDARQFMEKIEVYTTEVTQELLSAKLELTDNLPTCICPKCKENKILFYPRVAKCSNPDCGLIVFRNKGDKIINDKQLIELFDRLQTGVIKGFKRKDGGSFDAALKFDEKYNVVYAFPPKEKSKAKFTPKDKKKKR